MSHTFILLLCVRHILFRYLLKDFLFPFSFSLRISSIFILFFALEKYEKTIIISFAFSVCLFGFRVDSACTRHRIVFVLRLAQNIVPHFMKTFQWNLFKYSYVPHIRYLYEYDEATNTHFHWQIMPYGVIWSVCMCVANGVRTFFIYFFSRSNVTIAFGIECYRDSSHAFAVCHLDDMVTSSTLRRHLTQFANENKNRIIL